MLRDGKVEYAEFSKIIFLLCQLLWLIEDNPSRVSNLLGTGIFIFWTFKEDAPFCNSHMLWMNILVYSS